jgi:hypothetical protein
MQMPFMVIGYIARQQAPEMSRAQYYHVIEEFSSNAPNHSLRVRVLPR